MGYLSMVAAGGGHAQRAADLAAIAAAGRLGADPEATPAGAAARRRRGRPRETARGSCRCGSSVPAACRGRSTSRSPSPCAARCRSPGSSAGGWWPAPAPGSRSRPRFRPARFGRSPCTAPAGRSPPSPRPRPRWGGPTVWGGESRAEGGFDCSGLVDFAYAAAGDPLPGRPTAADLWRLAAPEPAGALAPADLVFVGAPSGAPHHVGMYVGDGMVVVAPHTGARVRFEPLAAGGWDGFGQADGGRGRRRRSPIPRSRRPRAPTRCRPTRSRPSCGWGSRPTPTPRRPRSQRAMRRHPGDLAAALGDALGDPSAGAFVLRSASGSALPGSRRTSACCRCRSRTTGAVRAGAPLRRAAGAAQASEMHRRRRHGRQGARARGRADRPPRRRSCPSRPSPASATCCGSGSPERRRSCPNPHLRNLATIAGAVWDGVESVIGARARGRRAARLRAVGGAGDGRRSGSRSRASTRGRPGRPGGGRTRSGTAPRRRAPLLTSVGAMTAGTDLIMLGAGTAEVPPLGAGLMLLGVAGARRRRASTTTGGWLAAPGAQRRGGWARDTAGRAAGAVARRRPLGGKRAQPLLGAWPRPQRRRRDDLVDAAGADVVDVARHRDASRR